MNRRSVILDACVRAEFHTLLLVSLYFLFAGHNQPGGGFAGGLVASCAFGLRFVAGGDREVRRAIDIAPPIVMGVGLLLAMITGLVPLALGDNLFESAIVEFAPPLIGKVKLTSVLFFDTGVYLVVVGMALMLLSQLGLADGSNPDSEHDEASPGAGPIDEVVR